MLVVCRWFFWYKNIHLVLPPLLLVWTLSHWYKIQMTSKCFTSHTSDIRFKQRQKLEQNIKKSTRAIDHVLPLVEPYGLQPNDLNRKSGRELRQNFLPSPCWSLSIILLKWWRRDKFQKWDVLISFFTCTVRLRAFLKRFWSKTKLPILRFEIWGPVQNMLPFMNVCHLVCFQILFWLNFWP